MAHTPSSSSVEGIDPRGSWPTSLPTGWSSPPTPGSTTRWSSALEVDLLVGDLDSVSQPALAEATALQRPSSAIAPTQGRHRHRARTRRRRLEARPHPPDRGRWPPPDDSRLTTSWVCCWPRRAHPGRPRGRALVGPAHTRRPRPGTAAPSTPRACHRLIATAPRSRHRRHDHRPALPAHAEPLTPVRSASATRSMRPASVSVHLEAGTLRRHPPPRP